MCLAEEHAIDRHGLSETAAAKQQSKPASVMMLGSEAPDKENAQSMYSNDDDDDESDVKVISGDIFPNLLNNQSERYEEFMTDADILVPETILERPRRRLKAFEEIKPELVEAIEVANEKIDIIHKRLRENAYDQ